TGSSGWWTTWATTAPSCRRRASRTARARARCTGIGGSSGTCLVPDTRRRSVRGDRGLIRYLLRHRHTTPFEMCEIKFHVKLPIFIARQWIRHRMANVNEYSARYSILDKEFYIPEPQHLASQSTINNQGRGAIIEGQRAQHILNLLREDSL